MSEHTAAVALDAMLITGVSDEDFGWEMLGLIEACGFEFERWCRVMGFEPDDPASSDSFERIHSAWAEAWNTEGAMFHVKLEPIVEKWERLLDHKVKIR